MKKQDSQDRRRRARLAGILGATALVSPLAATSAYAQAESEATVDQNTIIVTAQRRSEALEDVPMSVAVVTQETLANAGVTNLRDLANVTSGYQLGAGGAFPQPSVRGVTTTLNGTFENNVAVYIDGLYQPVAAGLNIDLPNVDNIQVLKGPQGTLYGRNSTGGALLLTTITPGDTWKGKAEFTYARFNDRRAAAYVAGPLSDKIGISLSGYIRRSDGYMRKISQTTPGATTCCAVPVKQDSLRAKIKVNLTDDFSATLAYNYTRVFDSRTNVYTPVENVPSNPYAVRPGAATFLPFLDGRNALGVEAYNFPPRQETRQHEGGLTLEWNTGIGTLRSITGYAQTKTYNRFDFDGSYVPSSFSASVQRERTFQQAIDLAVNAIEHVDLIVGGTYFHDRLKFIEPSTAYTISPPNPLLDSPPTVFVPLSSYSVAQRAFFDQKKDAWAIYGDLTFHATDQLSLNVGGRYSEETQDVNASQTSPFPPAAGLFRNPISVSSKFSKFTPRASIRYEISPRTNVYASYSKGFRSGAYNSQLPTCVNLTPVPANCYVPAKQETIDAYELGFKTAGHNFHFELAGFYYDYKDLQVAATRTLLVNGINFPVVEIGNAPKAKIYGADASFDFQPIENLTVRGSATWLHARYGDGFIFGGVGVNPAQVGINRNSDPLKTYINVSQAQDLSGLQMSRAPNFSGNIGMDYLIPRGEGGLRFAANVKYTSSFVLTNPSIWCQPTAANNNCAGVPVDRQRQQRFREGAYALLSASVTWTDPTGHQYIRIWGTNLTDHKYRLHYSGTGGGTYSPQAEPLVVGGTIGYKF